MRKKDRDFNQEKGLYQGGFLLLAILLLLAALGRFLHVEASVPPCVIHKWTGYYCPGCGGTRAVRALLKGNIWNSFLCHPVVPYGGILYAWYMISHTVEYLSKGKISIGMKYSDRYLYVAVALILVQWVVKNVLKAVWGIGLL